MFSGTHTFFLISDIYRVMTEFTEAHTDILMKRFKVQLLLPLLVLAIELCLSNSVDDLALLFFFYLILIMRYKKCAMKYVKS